MSVTTMEQLVALAEGETIRLGSRNWVRVGNALQQGNYPPVPFEEFADGTVPDPTTAEEPSIMTGQVRLRQHTYYRYVLGPAPTPGEWWVVRWNADQRISSIRSVAESTMLSYPRVPMPTWMERSHLMFLRWVSERLAEQVRFREVVQERLHEYGMDNGLEPDGAFSLVLQTIGLRPLPRPRETVTVTAAVHGSRAVTTEVLGLPVDALIQGETVPFVVNLTFEVDVEAGQCGCTQVTAAMVERRMTEVYPGITFDGFTVTCPN